jgi:ribosomal protein L28
MYCTGQRPVNTTRKIQICINSCLRMVLRIRWPDNISNKELWQRTNQKSADVEISQRCWRCIGHTLRKPAINTTRQAVRWNHQGKRKMGRPRNTWCRVLKNDAKETDHTWAQLERLAQDREGLRKLCPSEG